MFVRNGKAVGSIVHNKSQATEPEVVVDPEPVEDSIEVELDERTDTEREADEQAAAAREELGQPNTDWHRDRLDEYAAQRGLSTTDLPNKAAVLQAIQDSA